MKLIHLFNDDKFIDSAIELFEFSIPKKSDYYVIKSDIEDFIYVNNKNVIRIDLGEESKKKHFLNFLNNQNDVILCVHALDKKKQKLILELPFHIKVIWFVWGFDLYNNWTLYSNKLYKKETRKLLKKRRSFKRQILNSSFNYFLFRNKLYKYFGNYGRYIKNPFDTVFYKAVNRVSFVSTVVPTEMSFVKKIGKSLEYVPFNYACIEDLLGDNFNESVVGQPNILLGNSADPSNNHIEVFNQLSRINLDSRKVYVPLSYSGNKSYLKKVLAIGKKTLGENFVPLTQFLSLEEYNKILLSCGTLVFNHTRQQGLGNILSLTYLGAKVFLNEKSTVYEYFIQQGIRVNNTNKLSDKSLKKTLTNEEIKNNRNQIMSLYSKKNVQKKIVELYRIISKPKQ